MNAVSPSSRKLVSCQQCVPHLFSSRLDQFRVDSSSKYLDTQFESCKHTTAFYLLHLVARKRASTASTRYLPHFFLAANCSFCHKINSSAAPPFDTWSTLPMVLLQSFLLAICTRDEKCTLAVDIDVHQSSTRISRCLSLQEAPRPQPPPSKDIIYSFMYVQTACLLHLLLY